MTNRIFSNIYLWYVVDNDGQVVKLHQPEVTPLDIYNEWPAGSMDIRVETLGQTCNKLFASLNKSNDHTVKITFYLTFCWLSRAGYLYMCVVSSLQVLFAKTGNPWNNDNVDTSATNCFNWIVRINMAQNMTV